jgi:mannose-6-phosphate isomerase-like protein (cupin superfamily)
MKLIDTKKIGLTLKHFDFNDLVKIIDRNNIETELNGNWLRNYIFDNSFFLKNVQKDRELFPLYKDLNIIFNKEKKYSDMHFFVSFSSGGKCNPHIDVYDVYILGFYGKTLYKNEEEQIILEPGKILHIPKGEEHRAIGITPRIVLSFACYEND